MQNGPMLTLLYATEDFFMYSHGIYTPIEHVSTVTIYPVKLIGWGEGNSGYPYWIV